jgi:hypothetical protein
MDSVAYVEILSAAAVGATRHHPARLSFEFVAENGGTGVRLRKNTESNYGPPAP